MTFRRSFATDLISNALRRDTGTSLCIIAIKSGGALDHVAHVTETLPRSTHYVILRTSVNVAYDVEQYTGYAMVAVNGLGSLPLVLKIIP